MKSEDFINRYIGSNEWKNPYHETYRPLVEIEEPDPPSDPADPNPYRDDREIWMDLRQKILKDPFTLNFMREWSYDDVAAGEVYYYDVDGQDAYRFIRKVMDKITNPYGGYLYRRLHYLGYNQTIGILIPEGMQVDKEETFKAQTGGRVAFKDPKFVEACLAAGLMEYRRGQSSVQLDLFGGTHYSNKLYYVKEAWRERYVILYSDYFSYPDYALDDIVNAMINDLYFVKIKKTVDGIYKRFTNQVVSNPILDVFNSAGRSGFHPAFSGDVYKIFKEEKTFITQKPYQKVLMSLGWLISEMMLLIRYFKRLGSMIMYPIFPNFGFKGTMPTPIIDANIGAVMDLLDTFFKAGRYYYDMDEEDVKRAWSSAYVPIVNPGEPSPPPPSPPSGGSQGDSGRSDPWNNPGVSE